MTPVAAIRGVARMDHEALNDMKASELKIMCKGMGLRVSGSKSELINRIIEASEPAR